MITALLRDELAALMDARGLSPHDVARDCHVSYQTVKNVLDGSSPNARFVHTLISTYGLFREPVILRAILLSFLAGQFPDDQGVELLRCAGLLGRSTRT